MRILEHDFGEQGVNVVLHNDEPLPIVNGDTVQLEQVLINLLRNAVDSMEETSREQKQIEITCRQESDGTQRFLSVAVSDRGHGLTDEAMTHLFENFYTTKPDGIGLGLPICRSIIEAHGGQIECRPNATQGVTFRFTVPVSI